MSNGNSDTYSYKGWLISDSFWKRAIAVVGYSFVGQLVLSLVIGILIALFMVIAVFIFGMASVL